MRYTLLYDNEVSTKINYILDRKVNQTNLKIQDMKAHIP